MHSARTVSSQSGILPVEGVPRFIRDGNTPYFQPPATEFRNFPLFLSVPRFAPGPSRLLTNAPTTERVEPTYTTPNAFLTAHMLLDFIFTPLKAKSELTFADPTKRLSFQEASGLTIANYFNNSLKDTYHPYVLKYEQKPTNVDLTDQRIVGYIVEIPLNYGTPSTLDSDAQSTAWACVHQRDETTLNVLNDNNLRCVRYTLRAPTTTMAHLSKYEYLSDDTWKNSITYATTKVIALIELCLLVTRKKWYKDNETPRNVMPCPDTCSQHCQDYYWHPPLTRDMMVNTMTHVTHGKVTHLWGKKKWTEVTNRGVKGNYTGIFIEDSISKCVPTKLDAYGVVWRQSIDLFGLENTDFRTSLKVALWYLACITRHRTAVTVLQGGGATRQELISNWAAKHVLYGDTTDLVKASTSDHDLAKLLHSLKSYTNPAAYDDLCRALQQQESRATTAKTKVSKRASNAKSLAAIQYPVIATALLGYASMFMPHDDDVGHKPPHDDVGQEPQLACLNPDLTQAWLRKLFDVEKYHQPTQSLWPTILDDHDVADMHQIKASTQSNTLEPHNNDDLHGEEESIKSNGDVVTPSDAFSDGIHDAGGGDDDYDEGEVIDLDAKQSDDTREVSGDVLGESGIINANDQLRGQSDALKQGEGVKEPLGGVQTNTLQAITMQSRAILTKDNMVFFGAFSHETNLKVTAFKQTGATVMNTALTNFINESWTNCAMLKLLNFNTAQIEAWAQLRERVWESDGGCPHRYGELTTFFRTSATLSVWSQSVDTKQRRFGTQGPWLVSAWSNNLHTQDVVKQLDNEIYKHFQQPEWMKLMSISIQESFDEVVAYVKKDTDVLLLAGKFDQYEGFRAYLNSVPPNEHLTSDDVLALLINVTTVEPLQGGMFKPLAMLFTFMSFTTFVFGDSQPWCEDLLVNNPDRFENMSQNLSNFKDAIWVAHAINNATTNTICELEPYNDEYTLQEFSFGAQIEFVETILQSETLSKFVPQTVYETASDDQHVVDNLLKINVDRNNISKIDSIIFLDPGVYAALQHVVQNNTSETRLQLTNMLTTWLDTHSHNSHILQHVNTLVSLISPPSEAPHANYQDPSSPWYSFDFSNVVPVFGSNINVSPFAVLVFLFETQIYYQASQLGYLIVRWAADLFRVIQDRNLTLTPLFVDGVLQIFALFFKLNWTDDPFISPTFEPTFKQHLGDNIETLVSWATTPANWLLSALEPVASYFLPKGVSDYFYGEHVCLFTLVTFVCFYCVTTFVVWVLCAFFPRSMDTNKTATALASLPLATSGARRLQTRLSDIMKITTTAVATRKTYNVWVEALPTLLTSVSTVIPGPFSAVFGGFGMLANSFAKKSGNTETTLQNQTQILADWTLKLFDYVAGTDLSRLLFQVVASRYKTGTVVNTFNWHHSSSFRLNTTTLVFASSVDCVRRFMRVFNLQSNDVELFHNADSLTIRKQVVGSKTENTDSIDSVSFEKAMKAYMDYMNVSDTKAYGNHYDNDLNVVFPASKQEVPVLAEYKGYSYYLHTLGTINTHYVARYVTSCVSSKHVAKDQTEKLLIVLKAMQPTDGSSVEAWLTQPPSWDKADVYVTSLFHGVNSDN